MLLSDSTHGWVFVEVHTFHTECKKIGVEKMCVLLKRRQEIGDGFALKRMEMACVNTVRFKNESGKSCGTQQNRACTCGIREKMRRKKQRRERRMTIHGMCQFRRKPRDRHTQLFEKRMRV
jgi:hypothetical protein